MSVHLYRSGQVAATRFFIVALTMTLTIDSATAADESSEGWIEEIIVTAEKREENILRVPVTMSAFSEQMIEELGMSVDEDLENLVPGLQFGYDSEGNGTSMRGIGTQKPRQYNSDLAVTFYVDGIVTNDAYGLASNLFDIKRVEVARGPQGTLNGRNSIAGSVNYVHNKPTREWDVSLLSEFTDEFSQRYGIAFGGPVPMLDQFSFRITSNIHKGDGWQKNVGIGDNYAAADTFTISPQLRYQDDRWDVNLRYQLATDQGSSSAAVRLVDADRDSPTYLLGGIWELPNQLYLYQTPMPGIANCPPEQFRLYGGFCGDLENKVVGNRASLRDDETERRALNVAFDLTDMLTLRYTFGDTVTETAESRDGDRTDRVPAREDPFLPQDCVDQIGLEACRASGLSFNDSETGYFYTNDESSHELQLFSNFDGPLNFVAGVFTYENESHWRVRSGNYADPRNFRSADEATALVDRNGDGQPDFPNCQAFYESYVIGDDDPATGLIEGLSRDPAEFLGCAAGNNHLFVGGSASGAKTRTNAVFANVEYRFSDNWNVSGGLRHTQDKKDQRGVSGPTGVSFHLGVPIFRNQALPNRNDTWDGTIGHLSVEYTPDENRMFYGRISSGFRAGGFNQISGGTTAQDIANQIVPASFDKEELVNYEFGIKGRFLDGQAIVMAGAYFQDFDGFHLNETQRVTNERVAASQESPFMEFTNNIDGTEIWGAELEGLYYFNDNWRLSGFYAYIDSSVGDAQAFYFNRDDDQEGTFTHSWVDAETGRQLSAELPAPRNARGRQLPQQPNHKGSLTLTYTRGLASRGEIRVLGTWNYTSHMFPNSGNIPYQKIRGYARWDARVNWESPTRVWNLSGYVQNIADEIRLREYAFDWGWLTEPRQIGLQIRYKPEL